MSLALALDVDREKVDRRVNDNSKDIAAATFAVLTNDWYCREKGTLFEGTDKYNALQDAKEEAGLTVY